MEKPIVSVSNLRAGYGELVVLFDVTLDFQPGEWVLLIGPNGCGKSTLLKVISNLLTPIKGNVILNFSKSSEVKRGKNNIGFLKQTNNIFPALTVLENLKMAAFYTKDQAFDDYLEILFSTFPDLKDFRQKRAGLFSGGMRQKLAIGMAMARRHELLLLDEPTAGLAPHAAVEILMKTEELKNELSKSSPFTIIMVEHNYRYVKDKVTRVVGMREGKIVIDSYTPAKVLENKEEMEKIFFG
jgi:ABC-type branched-subunit amino acid transport system ATPase component